VATSHTRGAPTPPPQHLATALGEDVEGVVEQARMSARPISASPAPIESASVTSSGLTGGALQRR